MRKGLVVLLACLIWPVLASANLGHFDVMEDMARAFARMELPSYSGLGPDAAIREFSEFFGPSGLSMKKEKVEELRLKVQEYSAGKVRLELGDPAEFKTGVRGAAEYFVLIRGDEKKRIVVAPQYPPCMFD